MKEKWDVIEQSALSYQEQFVNFMEEITIPASKQKKWTILQKHWKDFAKHITEFGKYISPVDELKIYMPHPSEELFKTWIFWKDYLIEQHHFTMKSRCETKQLARLWKICEKDPLRAIEILDYSMSRGWKNFYEESKREQIEKIEILNTKEKEYKYD